MVGAGGGDGGLFNGGRVSVLETGLHNNTSVLNTPEPHT